MTFVDPPRPFSVAWLSESLYREDSSAVDEFLGEWAEVAAELGGTALMVDGWDEALDTAWEQLVTSSPGAAGWVTEYDAAKEAVGDQGLVVTFGDTRRVVGRRGHGGFGVSYPASLLTGAGDPVGAMRTATITVLDRHVEKAGLDVPLFSSVVSGR